jgi:hypothetical protein
MSHDLNKFGLHYFHDELHYTHAHWADWGPNISRLGAGWLTLTASGKRAIPEAFLRSVIDAGIQPIIHIPAKVGTISLREIAPILKSYAGWGIKHVVVFDCPNTQSAWNTADWSRGELIDRFADLILPILHVEREVGLKPMLPPLEPGGDYWDTAFLEALLSVINRRGQSTLVSEMGYALYAWSHGRPLNWGAGGPEAWPEAKPYQPAEGTEDHIGFRIFEWYQAIIQRVAGSEAPLFVVAGGYRPGVQARPEEPIEVQRQMYQFLLSDDAPAYLRCFNFDAFRNSTNDSLNWFDSKPESGSMVEAIQELQRNQQKSINANVPKTIEHYALLPPAGTQHALEIWQKTAPFAMAIMPTVGFSLEEALYAKKVTILAGEREVPLEAQQRLEDSGCDVTRIDAKKDEKLLAAIATFAANRQQAGGEHE